MEDREKKINVGDLIFKAILIIIIILLLIHNCSTVNKIKGQDEKGKTPTGNIDIFEIKCEKDTCQDVLGDKTETQKPEPEKPTVTPGGNNGSKPSTTPAKDNNKKDDNNSSSGNNDNQGGSTIPGGNTEPTEPDEPDQPDEPTDTDLIVKDTIEWKSQNELRIFDNPAYQMEPKIAPESSNTYEFIVRNNTSTNVKYKIEFMEENANNINMKFRLKRGNEYVVGNDTTWVRYADLDLEGILLNSSSDHTYYLEWKWFSSDNDTAIGANPSSKYKLNIVISAESQNA